MERTKKIQLPLIIAALSSFMQSCQSTAPQVQCHTRTFGITSGYEAKTFSISTPGKPHTLESKQYEEYARQALLFKGMKLSSNPNKSDLNITIEYGISAPREITNTHEVPIFGQTGISSISSNGAAVRSYGGYQYNQTSIVTPTYGVTNMVTVAQQETVFDRFLKIKANRHGEATPRWNVEVFSTGASGDMNYVLPYMFVAATEAMPNPSGMSDQFTINQSAVRKRIYSHQNGRQ